MSDSVFVSITGSSISVQPTDPASVSVIIPDNKVVVIQTGGAASVTTSSNGITDATATGRAVLTATDAATARAAIGVPAGSGTSTGANTGDQDLSPYAPRPTNTTDPTALTAQTPNTLVASSTLTFTAAVSDVCWPVTTSGGTGVEVSFDAGYSWQASGSVKPGGTVKLRAVSPTYGGTDVITLNVGGRSYTWSVTSRDWTYADLSDVSTIADLRADATFYQGVTGTTAATAGGDPVGQWIRANGVGDAVAAASGSRLKLALASSVKVITGDGSTVGALLLPTAPGTAPSEWTFAARVRTTGNPAGGPYFGLPETNSSRFFGTSATVVGFFSDGLGLSLSYPGPASGTWFIIAARRVGTALQFKVHTGAWATVYTGSYNPFGTGQQFKIASPASAMSANQQVSDALLLPFALSDAAIVALCTQWGVSS